MTAKCGCRCDLDTGFDTEVAIRDLDQFRSNGLPEPTRRLADVLTDAGIADATVLDIGGGVGAIHHALLAAGARSVVDVDGSSAYLAIAAEEAARRGQADRVAYRHGDFVDLSDEVAPADIVTLVGVLCCYPAMEPLVRASAAHARRLYGLVYPRSRWWIRAASAIYARVRRPGTGPGYIHTERAVDATVRGAGFAPIADRSTFYWRVVAYRRT